MHILVINYEYPPIGGGGGFVTRDFAEAWIRAGHDVTVVTTGFGGLNAEENVNGVRVIRVPVLKRSRVQTASHLSMLSYVPSAIWTCLRRKKNRFAPVDIVNTHFAVPSGPAGDFVARFLKVPNVLSIHGGDIFDPSKSLSPHKTPVLRNVVTSMLNRADRVVAQSSDTRNNANSYYKIKRDIDIIPLGIRKPSVNSISRKALGLSEDEFIMSTIGRLVKRKNIEGLLEVVSRFDKDMKIRLLIIGDGIERDFLVEKAKQLGLDERVLFCGPVDDERKFQLLNASDIYVSTAIHEGFGLVFLEAMECGLPVVCFDRGGQSDFLIEGKTGFLVPLNDTELFAYKVKELYIDTDLKKKQAAFCRDHISHYYIDQCAERYIELFKEMIGKESSRGFR